ncbi:DUF397 domain-containing protein [Actinophytocola xanthii]|uniref:DUF397 domain-containing protein n=1 Tax=Actinophytocola xanthii TaxID=1912961 RepID=UPI0009FACB1C|nr:DUF397 domain-containing protein [Actinophytocola xanthii]
MEWRKSSFSGDSGACVEIRRDLAAVRDSKCHTTVMPVSPAALAELLEVARRR